MGGVAFGSWGVLLPGAGVWVRAIPGKERWKACSQGSRTGACTQLAVAALACTLRLAGAWGVGLHNFTSEHPQLSAHVRE